MTKELQAEFGARQRGEAGRHRDIMEHLETLSRYAETSRRIGEFGTRTGNSTVALAHGLAKSGGGELYLFDLTFESFDAGLEDLFAANNVACIKSVGDTAKANIPESLDFLFVDTLHTFEHVRAELLRVTMLDDPPWFIGFHDTELNGWHGEHGAPGILPAILEFMASSHYRVAHYARNCNGLMIIQRI